MYTVHHKRACKFCGKEFDVACVERHEKACQDPNSLMNSVEKSRVHVRHDGLACIYCGKICKNKNSLAQHEIRCKENPERKDYNNLVESGLRRKGHTKEDDPIVAKCAAALKQKYAEGYKNYWLGKTGTFTGKHHTEESKEKIRLSTLNYIKKTQGNVSIRYNKAACEYIENLNQKNNWHLQHAENGGEVCIGGYYVDGYDAELNIVFEYDEPRHYEDAQNNILRKKDLDRMLFIIEKLNCRFFRYNEKIDYFYEFLLQ